MPISVEQDVENLASLSLETNGIPDPYYFLVTPNGKLFSPSAYCNVEDVVLRTNRLGQLEYRALRSIEQWATSSNEGVVAWISPLYPGVYPVSKVIISEIHHEDGIKKLFNRAILLDLDERKCLKFAQNLAQFSQNRPLLSHLDEVRSVPLILNTRISWIHILEELIDDSVLWESIRNGDDTRAKKEAVRQARVALEGSFDARTAIIIQMLGPGSGSCPMLFNTQKGTASQLFSESALTFSGSTSKDPDFCKTCPVCGSEINCVVRTGGNCPKCGVVKKGCG